MANPLDRPTVLTPEAQQAIVSLLAEGNYLTTACRAAGFTPHTFNYWRRLYESGAEHAQHLADFFGKCAQAVAIGEASALRDVRSGRNGWQAAAWFLGRRHSKRWAERKDAAPTPDVTYADIPDSEPDVEPRRAGEAEEGVPE